MTLLTETNTPEMETIVLEAFATSARSDHRRVNADFEHGQWWTTCLDCGAQWGACDSDMGFEFERVTEGDGYCEAKERA